MTTESKSDPAPGRGAASAEKGPGGVRRKSVRVSAEELVRSGPLRPGSPLPLVAEPAVEGVELGEWAVQNRERLEQQLLSSGAILFRNFGVRSVEQFDRFMRGLSGPLLEYTYGSTPRTKVQGQVYTSTEYPAHQEIPPHNEMSYSKDWPMKIWFLCLETAQSGGETPIVDSRRVYQRLNSGVREQFASRQVMYVRNYGEGLDVPWQKVFRTEDRTAVEQFCRSAGIESEWLGGDRLRTREVCQAVARHPRSGEMVWFNQAHLFHVSNLSAEEREALLGMYAEEDLPRNAYYGDGTPIEPSALEEVRQVYRDELVSFPWEVGDVMMLDNMLTAHGRKPYSGSRRIVVGMAESVASLSA